MALSEELRKKTAATILGLSDADIKASPMGFESIIAGLLYDGITADSPEAQAIQKIRAAHPEITNASIQAKVDASQKFDKEQTLRNNVIMSFGTPEADAANAAYTAAHPELSSGSSSGGGLFGFETNPITQVAGDFSNTYGTNNISPTVAKYTNTIGDIGTAAVVAQTLGSAQHAINTPDPNTVDPATGEVLDPKTGMPVVPIPNGGGSYKLPDGSFDYTKLLDLLGPTLGYVGADKMAEAQSAETQRLRDLADKYAAYGEPYRQKLSDLYNDPTSFLNSAEVQKPVQMGTDMLSRSLSMGGNPVGSGNALQQLQSYSADQLFGSLGQEKDRLARYGGLANYNAAAPQVATGATGVNPWDATKWNALGAGADAVSNIFNPKTNYFNEYWKKQLGGVT